jgi:hypothetical protein
MHPIPPHNDFILISGRICLALFAASAATAQGLDDPAAPTDDGAFDMTI